MSTVATTTRAYADDPQLDLARLTLSLGVPVVIDDLSNQIDPDTGKRGPNDYQRDEARSYIERQRLGEAVLFYSKGETAQQMRLLIEIVAIMAFCPGGVNVLGLHFEACAERQVAQ